LKDDAVDMKLQVASFGAVPGTNQMQFMINASFNEGLFEAFTMTVLVPSGHDRHVVEGAALARARELAQAFYLQSQTTPRQLPGPAPQEAA